MTGSGKKAIATVRAAGRRGRAIRARRWAAHGARVGVMTAALLLGAGRETPAATQPQIDLARDKAAAWLIRNQQGDGLWTKGEGADLPVSAQALLGLVSAGVKGYPVFNANAWLLNNKPESVDALSRILMARALPSVNQNAGFQLLLAWRNADVLGTISLWGAYPQYGTSIADTALAWRSLLASGYDLAWQEPFLRGALCRLIAAQRADGSWGINLATTGGTAAPAELASGAVLSTTQTVLMMKLALAKASTLGGFACAGGGAAISTLVDTAVNNAVTYLATTVRNADGGVGENGVSTLLATAQAYQALQVATPANPSTAALLDYLISSGRQLADGSWNGDPMVTGVMLEALSTIASPGSDADGDGIADSIEVAMGSNPGVPDTRNLANKPTGSGQPGMTLPLTIANQVPVNVPYVANLAATGGTPPYTWSITGGALPPGLGLARATGTISGTPTAIGTYTFEYTVKDDTGATAAAIGQLVVVRAAQGSGDVNADGKVDLADVILAQRIALGQIAGTAQERAAADVAPPGEPDGVIDAADVARILRKALAVDSF